MQVVDRATVAASRSWSDALAAAPRAFCALADGAVDQARAQIHAHLEALPHLQVAVRGRDRARTAALAADVGAEPTDDLAAAVATSDIVITTTTSSRTPPSKAAWVRPGTHLTAVGSLTLGEVLTDPRPGRTRNEQITVADLCGLGAQDAAIAERVVTRLLVGTDGR